MINIDEVLLSLNIAEKLDEDKLKKIGESVKQGYELDLQSRASWEDQNTKWMELALQVAEEKTYPWPGAANVKYPLLTTAALQFGSRAYPSLVPSFDVVKAKVIGKDDTNEMSTLSSTISTHMSYQVLYEMDGWEEDMDKLCFTLPILGCIFKKTYYSAQKKKNCSELIFPKDLVINYWAKSLDKASRKTHCLRLTPNEIIERQRQGIFLEHENYKFASGSLTTRGEVATEQNAPADDKDTPRLILEQHTFLDLDDDDYKEPYVVTIDYDSGLVLRIAPRFVQSGITRNDKGEISSIKPTEYFTQFNFIPNPEGGIYGVGFGLLLGSINESANTVLNQLIDAGSLSNLQSGFITKGLRLGKAGDYKFTPGEWKVVNSTFDDVRKGLFPLPVREPSNVLFQLLGMLVNSGKELASIAEIFTGKMPGQNTPASTTMATIEQGLKVFTSIYKRIYRALGEEFTKLYTLNAMYLPAQEQEFAYDKDGVIVDAMISKEIYQKAKMKIVPAADPNMVSETQKLILQQGLMELAQFGHINPQVLTKRGLEMQGQPGIPELMEVPPPQPPPDFQVKMRELDILEDTKNKELALQAEAQHSESLKRMSEVFLNLAKAEELGVQTTLNSIMPYIETLFKEEEGHRQRVQMIMQAKESEDNKALEMEKMNAAAAQQGGTT